MGGRKRKRADSSSESDSEHEDAPRRHPGLQPRSLVAGGKPATRGQFPYQAGLLVTRSHGRRALCGAALLSDRWLLTAAHCCMKGTAVRVYLGAHPTMFHARQEVDANVVVVHPRYNRKVPGHFDIALVHLKKPVILSEEVKPVRLPTWGHVTDDFAGRIATLSGWGKVADDDEGPSKGTAVLRFARERILSCEQAEEILHVEVPPYFICAKGLNKGQGSCKGDSGGPLVVEDNAGQPFLVGVVSHRYGTSCVASRAHVCTRVTSFLPWITSVTREPLRPKS